jgi:hypothetical protein
MSLSSRFSQYAATSAEPMLVQLLKQCPILRQICERLDENFYQYLREKGRIVHLSENCINGLAVSMEARKNHTISFLLASPGEVEEPCDILEAGVRETISESKDGRGKNQKSADDTGGAVEEYFDCLED